MCVRFSALASWSIFGHNKTIDSQKSMPHRDRWFKALLTQQELDKLHAYADRQGWNMSQAFREWIKELPCYSDSKQN